jgi:Ca2+-binding RTX toxin-like protein
MAVPGNDLICGYDERDQLYGQGGHDKVKGGPDVRGGLDGDVVSGGAGYDILFGNDGQDRLIGGPGNDRLYGGLPGRPPRRGPRQRFHRRRT